MLLLLEDDRELARMIRTILENEGFAVDLYRDGAGAWEALQTFRHDLALLDVLVPGLDGFEVLRKLRQVSTMPVIMLTAKTGLRDRVQGLSEGADDYLPKPFEAEELLARIRSVLRRATGTFPPSAKSAIHLSSIRLDRSGRNVAVAGMPVPLTTVEFDILECLMTSAGQAVSREELSAHAQQRAHDPLDRSLDVHVSHLRKKIERGEPLIRTVRNIGYLFAVTDGLP